MTTAMIIYLQVDSEFDEITWCQDRINDTDVEYVRADVAGRQLNIVLTALAAARSELEQLKAGQPERRTSMQIRKSIDDNFFDEEYD